MTDTIDTIEVPVELIKVGNMDAIRELLPTPNLFGRWAKHPDYGRGIIVSPYPDRGGVVWFFIERKDNSGKRGGWLHLEDLTLDPVELTTVEDFENAPEGTIVEAFMENACQKVYPDNHWESRNDTFTNEEMAASGTWKILRLGWG